MKDFHKTKSKYQSSPDKRRRGLSTYNQTNKDNNMLKRNSSDLIIYSHAKPQRAQRRSRVINEEDSLFWCDPPYGQRLSGGHETHEKTQIFFFPHAKNEKGFCFMNISFS
jgi:hypothetical protein